MNPIQIQLSVTLDSDSLADLLVQAIQKGTGEFMAKMLQAVQERTNHAIMTPNSTPTSAAEPTQNDGDSALEPKLIDINSVASMLGVSSRMVWRLRDSGKMPKPVFIGRLVRWPSETIDEWIQAGCPAIERRGVQKRDVR